MAQPACRLLWTIDQCLPGEHRGPVRLRRVIVGGEALSTATVRLALLAPASAGHAVVNGYGPTETTMVATHHAMKWPQVDRGSEPCPIGRPIWNTQVYVLDDNLQPVPVGVAGELYIGGSGLARGYLHRPGLTSERFVAHPFGEPGSRLYRTGDRVRWLAEGELDFLGRADAQVKIRGFRIELGEIEAGLLQQPGVVQAAVVVREERAGSRQLVGYVVAGAGHSLDTAVLRRSLAERLPDYMVPAAIVVIDALPLTPNGKLDRKALPAPDYAAAVSRAPRTAREEILAGLFAQVLGLERVGIDASFFDLGGDSISSIQLVSRARKAGLVLAPRQVFQHQSVAALAMVATQLEGDGVDEADGSDLPLLALTQEQIEHLPSHTALDDVLPLAPQQQGFYFHSLYEAASSNTYQVQVVFALNGPLDGAVLQEAAHALLQRHPNLRAGFIHHGFEHPVQLVAHQLRVPWQDVDLSMLTAPMRQSELQRIVEVDRAGHFDLARAPLLRFVLIRLADDRHQLVFSFHHILLDGWSIPVVMQELFALYRRRGDAGCLPRATPYRDLPGWVQRKDPAAARNAWVEHLRRTGTSHPSVPCRPAPPDVPRRGPFISRSS